MTETAYAPAEAGVGDRYLPHGAHLVGSIPLPTAEQVFRAISARLGDRLRRLPDGETGPRADWIVWQYPILSSRQEFEVAPPVPGFYRALPRLKLRPGAAPPHFDGLGYAEAARASYAQFSVLKRDGVVPRGCRFQISLPTPLAPISAFVAVEDQPVVEPAYEAAMARELDQILDAIPPDQLALQWDTNFEFGMLERQFPVWFPDVKGAVLERLIRISRAIPEEVELGFHFCSGHDEQTVRPPVPIGRMVEIANAVSASLGRTLNWVHVPLPAETDVAVAAPLHGLRLHPATELYLGAVHPGDDDEATLRRIDAARAAGVDFGLATPCGWGRLPAGSLESLLAAHARLTRPVADPEAERGFVFAWPPDFPRVPDEDWVREPVDDFGLSYDTVETHGWYANLDLTVEQLASDLRPGQILVDYSGGTGILLDRLRLRIFDRPIGMLIVDSSPKFMRVALDRFRTDERVAFRRLHYLRDEGRLERLDEAIGNVRPEVIVSTNAVHLYEDLEKVLRSWHLVLGSGGRVRINSGNIRNPHAGDSEWIIDETVYVAHEVASGLVRTDARYAAYREVLDDPERLAPYLAYRDRVFLAPRPLDEYLRALGAGGFTIDDVSERTIDADVDEWFSFLSTYADAVLGWVGGAEKVDGAAASDAAARDRLELLRRSLDVIFGGRPTFRCCWTYISAVRD